MLEIDNENHLRLLSIDPGTDTVGVAINSVDLEQGQLHVLETVLLNGGKRLRFDSYYQYLEEIHGARHARISVLGECLYKELQAFQPHDVVCESPFVGKRMTSAFEALVQVIHAFRSVLYRYDPFLSLELIAPMKAKEAVNQARSDVKKEDIRTAVEKISKSPQKSKIYFSDEVDIHQISEHEIDAIVIAYARFRHWLKVLKRDC